MRGAEFIESALIDERFELRKNLGEGGFGVVFEAWDRERRARVALKALHRVNATSVLRFKREFRTLADFSHRNLVQLYELLADGPNWFMTMEYVDGGDFIEGVARYIADHELENSKPLAETMDLEVPSTGPLPTIRHHLEVDWERLTDATRQLALGIGELHSAGILHRDIKPSNVLIDRSDRVILLDFGMIQELRPATEAKANGGGFMGTPHYIAPEQAMGKEAQSASDWYSVGVMLHEVMTGYFPIDGRTSVQIMLRKQVEHTPERDRFSPEAPEELVELCRDCLSLDPDARPNADEVLSRLTGDGYTAADVTGEVFVGRLDEMAELDHARRAARSSRQPVISDIRGASGMGKSALVREFLGRLDEDVVVLRGRCYESESVPFKALDGVIDELFEYFRHHADARKLLETVDLESIARLFPVMAKLLPDGDEVEHLEGDQLVARQRGFHALRSLFNELCRDRQVVVWVDDAQWGDRDSVALMSVLIRGEGPPPIQWILTARAEDRNEGPFLTQWRELRGDLSDRIKTVDIEVGALSEAESMELASTLLGDAAGEVGESIQREANGHPFFIDELARHRASRVRVDSTITSLDDLIRYRFDALDESSKKLLEVVAVAGQPLEWQAAREVARLGDEAPSTFARLRNERLLRIQSLESGNVVEAYHDRIRETVRDTLSGDRRQSYHLSIANSLLELAPGDYDRLRIHYREGGDRSKASKFARAAGDAAVETLAFDEAIDAYGEALQLGEWSREEQFSLHNDIADANALLARGNEAADAFRSAAKLAPDEETQVDLEQRAAEQLIRCGQLERGMTAMSSVMGRLGVATPSNAMLIPSIIWGAIRLKLRGDEYEVAPDGVSRMERARLDAFWALANLMATIDVRRGAYYQIVNLREALDSGDRVSILRALGLQAVHDATTPKQRDRAPVRIAEARSLLEDVTENPAFHESWLAFAQGLVHYMAGEFAEAVRWCEEAVDILRTHRLSTRWEVASIETYSLQALFFTGDLGGFRDLALRMIEDAEAARDFLHLIAVGLWAHYVDLADADPDAAMERLDRAIGGWSDQDFHLQDFWYLKGSVNVAIYRGEGKAALQRVHDEWSDVRKAFILNSETGLVTAWDLRLRAAICAAVDGDIASARREFRRAKRALSKWSPAWGMAIMQLHEAEIAVLQGSANAADLLARAEAACDDAGVLTYRDAARVLLGRVVGGDRGDEMRRAPLGELEAAGVKSPEAFLSVFAPALRRFRVLLDEPTG